MRCSGGSQPSGYTYRVGLGNTNVTSENKALTIPERPERQLVREQPPV